MKIRLPHIFALLELCSVLVYAQEEAKKLAEAASRSRANLLSASNAYRASLEKLLELQRQDESRAAERVKKLKELLALGKIGERELEDGEDRKSTRLNSSHLGISYAVFC